MLLRSPHSIAYVPISPVLPPAERATEALRLSLEVRAAAIEAEAGMLERREVAASAAQSRMRALEESMGSVGRGGAGDEGGEERVREMEREVER